MVELAPPHAQSVWGLAACCNYFSKKNIYVILYTNAINYLYTPIFTF